MDPSTLTAWIRTEARDAGFDLVGISRVEQLPGKNLREWLDRGLHGDMEYMSRNTERRLDPREILSTAQSIVSVGLNYYHDYPLPYEERKKGVISRYAAGKDYHKVLGKRLKRLLRRIQEEMPECQGRYYVDTGPVLDKVWASRAGLGWLGKHTNVINKQQRTSWFFVGELLLNLELEADSPGTDHCGSCTRCIEACPTDAIIEPYVLDSRSCISYLTIELREDIPTPLRKPMSNLVFGCDICQDVCPWNRKAVAAEALDFKPRPINERANLREMAGLSREEFDRVYAGSPIRRARYEGFQRNVAIAMGNSRSIDFMDDLKAMLRSESPMVRRHAAWALCEIDPLTGPNLVQEALSSESDQKTIGVFEEILGTSPESRTQ